MSLVKKPYVVFAIVLVLVIGTGCSTFTPKTTAPDTKVKTHKFHGIEFVWIPAGTFETMKIELTNTVDAARSTIYVSTSDRRVVKIESVAPQMNGAILTAELK